MMGIVVPETCWASNKICNKNHLLHLVGILFPHTTEGKTTRQYKGKKSVVNTNLHKHGFLIITANVTSIYLNFASRHCCRQTSGTLLSPTTSDWGCLPRFPSKSLSRTVARYGSTDWDSFMVRAWWRSTTFSDCSSRILEQHFARRGGTTGWPLCSPDFSPLHFYLWRHLRSTVCATEVSEVQDSQQRIQNGFDMIRTTPGKFFRRVVQSLHKRASSCIEAQFWH